MEQVQGAAATFIVRKGGDMCNVSQPNKNHRFLQYLSLPEL